MAFPVSQPVPSYSANYPEQSFSDPFLQKVTNQKLEQKSRHSNSQSLDDSPPSTPSQSRPPSRIASYLSIASMAVAQNSSALANIFKSADLSPSSPHNNINLFPEMKEVRRVSDTNIKATETNSYSLILGSGVLFLLGFSIARTVGTLQKASEFLPPSSHLVYQSPLACGAGALLLGILLPIIDQSTNTNIQRDVNGAPWSIIIRVIGGLVAFTWAANKLQWTSNLQVEVALGVMNLGLWFIFDQTLAGFGLGAVIGIGGALTSGSSTFSQACWIVNFLFTSLICFGNIGRKLLRTQRNVEIKYLRNR